MNLPHFWRSLGWVWLVITFLCHEVAFTPDINWVSQSAKKKIEITEGEGLQMRMLMVKKPTEAFRKWLTNKTKLILWGRTVLSNKCNG
ncbi:hypothetical protein NC653_037862 [Populus alba x Populus x berolinensis]|uniref:Uncharacterized protein n=1 Tax=Populus alba x Populus x berolinensis TaxID=444605 RepID=A0AAD6LHZ1_9ROSI|nr:hypothetical protein NC653_037862 [Populus alba x Populus x berolinensis]